MSNIFQEEPEFLDWADSLWASEFVYSNSELSEATGSPGSTDWTNNSNNPFSNLDCDYNEQINSETSLFDNNNHPIGFTTFNITSDVNQTAISLPFTTTPTVFSTAMPMALDVTPVSVKEAEVSKPRRRRARVKNNKVKKYELPNDGRKDVRQAINAKKNRDEKARKMAQLIEDKLKLSQIVEQLLLDQQQKSAKIQQLEQQVQQMLINQQSAAQALLTPIYAHDVMSGTPAPIALVREESPRLGFFSTPPSC